MSNQTVAPHGVMEGQGAYNKHAKLPADAAVLALPLLERGVADLEIKGDEPIVIADYGSSQGKNSQAPIRVAIRGLRKRFGPHRAISVFHIDQPANDFNSLFQVLNADPNRYVAGECDIYPAAIGKSFYEKVLPPGSVHLGWSSYAAVWLSRVPTLIPGHFISVCTSGEVRAAFDRQAAKDWETFLTLRAQEMRPGGRLLVVLPGFAEDDRTGFEPLFDHANSALGQLVVNGAITSEERSRMAIAGHPRRKQDLLSPFKGKETFQQLLVEDCTTSEVLDSAWAQYELDGDMSALASKRALFFRSIFVPSLASALNAVQAGDSHAAIRFGDQLELHLKERLMSDAAPMHSWVQAILLAKEL